MNTTTSPTAHLEARLERLENDTRRWRRSALRLRTGLGALLAINAAALIVAAVDVPEAADVLLTQRLEIVGPDGNLVASVTGDERGGRLDLWSAEGSNVVRLSANDVGGDLNLWTNEGGTVFSAFASPAGGEFGLWSSGGERTLRIATAEHGGKLEVMGAGGRAVVSATAEADGGALSVASSAGSPVFTARGDAAGAGLLNVHNADGSPLLTVESSDLFGSSLLLSDATGHPRVMARTEERGGALSFANEAGKLGLTLGIAGPGRGGFLDIANAQGARVIAAGADDDGCGRFDLSNDDGQRVFMVDGVADVGAAVGLFSARGKKAIMFGSRNEGGLVNLFNQHEVPVFVAGYAEENLGGAMSVKNGRGIPIIHGASDELGHGRLTVFDVEGKRRRIVQTPR